MFPTLGPPAARSGPTGRFPLVEVSARSSASPFWTLPLQSRAADAEVECAS